MGEKTEPDTSSGMAQRLAGFGTWTWEVRSGELTWSKELYRIYGRDPEVFAPSFESFLGCVYEADREKVRGSVSAALGASDSFEHEERIVRPDGALRLLRSAGRVERDETGAPARVLGACLDITEQREAEVALARRDAELRRALAAARMGTITWLHASGELRCSSEVERLVGVAVNTIHDLTSCMGLIDRRAFEAAAAAAVATVGRLHSRFRVDSDAAPRWLQLVASVERDHQGAMVIEGTLADITEEVGLEGQLLQAQKMESVGRLAGGVAHDFNNLLTVILGELDLARSGTELDSHTDESLRGVYDAACRASDLTRTLLTLAREQPVSLDYLDLADVVRRAVGLYKRVLGELIELEVKLPAEACPVMMDGPQLEQLLLNLMTNAREAMPEGGRVVITVTLDGAPAMAPHGGGDAGDWVLLDVTDSGPGIAPEIVNRIFDPFFTTKKRGTGLGLATCFGVVDRHGGTIKCVSEPGAGASFRTYLPRGDRATRVKSEASPEKSTVGTETLLLVEDERSVRDLAVRVLRGQGYQVLEAGDGEEALEVLSSSGGTIDLLVTDVVMPRLGGVPLADRIRKQWPGVPVLFLSGYAADEFTAGIPSESVLLRKPFLPATLSFRVREVLDAARERVSIPPPPTGDRV